MRFIQKVRYFNSINATSAVSISDLYRIFCKEKDTEHFYPFFFKSDLTHIFKYPVGRDLPPDFLFDHGFQEGVPISEIQKVYRSPSKR
jgi:hypothetical protein